MDGLTPKQRRFVEEFLANGRNASAAYRAAYDCSRMSEASVHQNASKLLRHAKVAPRVQAAVQKAEKATDATAERVIRELALAAFSDLGDVLDFSSDALRLRPASQIPEAARRAIASVKVRRVVVGSGEDAREVEVLEFKLCDKLQALQLLGKHLGLFVDRSEVTTTTNINVTLTDEQRREALLRLSADVGGPDEGPAAVGQHPADGSLLG